MFDRLGNLVTRHWVVVVLVWAALAILLPSIAPRWRDIAHDGDFAYLPSDRPSVVGSRLVAEAFPQIRAKSQIVISTVRPDEPLANDDIYIANDLARRFRNLLGVVHTHRARQLIDSSEAANREGRADDALSLRQRADQSLHEAVEAFQEAVRLDRGIAEYHENQKASASDVTRLAIAYHNFALALSELEEDEQADEQREIAWSLDPGLKQTESRLLPEDAVDLPLLDVWTWHDKVVGKKLQSDDKHARVVLLKLSNEFMAVDNIRVLDLVQSEIDEVRRELKRQTNPGLEIGISGSAAVGGDLLTAARDSIRHTEMFTIALVVLVLVIVYRSPLLVAIPLTTITVSYLVATSLIALLTQLHYLPGFQWCDVKVFTTTKVFIVVILFGAGTDFCLFLISRFQEELRTEKSNQQPAARSLSAVGDALAASALTTIVGLLMMYFAEFGKFSSSGPVIGLCLAITLVASTTLAPALLHACGGWIFWPLGTTHEKTAKTWTELPWQRLAHLIVMRPGVVLTTCVVVLFPLGVFGWWKADYVSYDLLNALSKDRPSRRGTELLRPHFSVGESGPATIVIKHSGTRSLKSDEGRLAIADLTHALYKPRNVELRRLSDERADLREQLQAVLDLESVKKAYPQLQKLAKGDESVRQLLAVTSVRSATDPLGTHPPGKAIGIFGRSGRKALAMREHPRSQIEFVGRSVDTGEEVARFEVILRHDPFSIEAISAMSQIDQKLHAIISDPSSFWFQSTVAYTGTTAAIRDLREVTRSDNQLIQILVVLAVFGVLLAILRRPIVCGYMVLSVLFTYFVTLGITHLLFGFVYGPTYQGLDWKVPLFLFVILVAVGQDYNVYLATRVFEEQQRYGPFAGLRRAVVKTGGIITSCGVIMACTFISMTSGNWPNILSELFPPLTAWLPASGGSLRSIVELGFALALGVAIDTFVVRPVLLPAFLALVFRWQASRHLETIANVMRPPAHEIIAPEHADPSPESGTQ